MTIEQCDRLPSDRGDNPGAQAMPLFSVVIPAHNEATVIGDTLRRLVAGMPPTGGPEVIVVANGCRDGTAAAARAVGGPVRVIELTTGSKSLALNTGLGEARHRPVLFMDADVRVDLATLAAVASNLTEPGVLAASPAANLVTHDSDPLVRAYYRTWARHPYLRHGVGGSGVVGLSEAGIAELGRFPSVLADDTLIRAMFPLERQRRVFEDAAGRPVRSDVLVPKTVWNLIACESRWRSGDDELLAIDPAVAVHPGVGPASARTLWRASPSASDFFIYCGVKVAGRLLQRVHRRRGRARIWHRDESRRAG